MQRMLIGSRAIQITKSLIGTPFEGLEKRTSLADYDYAVDLDEYSSEMINGVRYELHPMTELFAFQHNDINDILLTIKLSHCIYDISFSKTMKDIALLKFLGAKPIDELLLILQEKWKQPKFAKTHKRDHRGFDFPHEELFNDNVPRLIDQRIAQTHFYVSTRRPRADVCEHAERKETLFSRNSNPRTKTMD